MSKQNRPTSGILSFGNNPRMNTQKKFFTRRLNLELSGQQNRPQIIRTGWCQVCSNEHVHVYQPRRVDTKISPVVITAPRSCAPNSAAFSTTVLCSPNPETSPSTWISWFRVSNPGAKTQTSQIWKDLKEALNLPSVQCCFQLFLTLTYCLMNGMGL